VADKESSSREEPSDLFKVENATPSIAPVNKIVLPPAEALKRRIRRFIAAGIVALIFFFIVHTVLGWIHDARLASSLDEVISDASPDVIDGALALLRDDPNDSVRARLLATAGLGGDLDKLKQAETLLAESAQQNDPDQRIARIYAFLAEGDPRAAHAEAERPAKYSEQADAFLLGRAWTAIARGQWMQALPDAEKVVDARPAHPSPLRCSRVSRHAPRVLKQRSRRWTAQTQKPRQRKSRARRSSACFRGMPARRSRSSKRCAPIQTLRRSTRLGPI